jgi:PhnB protein
VASVSTYLNFPGNTEAAFLFYRSVFGTGFDSYGIMRMGDVPPDPGQPPLSEADSRLVMHVCLPILGGHLLMGTDCVASRGQTVTMGNNVHISLQTDTRAQADELFAKLSEGGRIDMPMQDMFWGDYFGSLVDRFGVQWMLNCASKA